MRKKELWQKVEKAATERGVKQYKYLYRRMLDENIIRKAYKKLRKGKTKRIEIQKIDADLDNEVAAMRRMIENTKPPDVPVEHPELAYKPKKRKPKIIREKGQNPEDIYAGDTRAMAAPYNRPYFGADYNSHGLPIFLRQLPEAGRTLRQETAFKNYPGRKEYPEFCED